MPVEKREKASACAVHAEAGFWDEDSETEPEQEGTVSPDNKKPVGESGPVELMTQVAQAQTQMYHALMQVKETKGKLQEQGLHPGGSKRSQTRGKICLECGEARHFTANRPKAGIFSLLTEVNTYRSMKSGTEDTLLGARGKLLGTSVKEIIERPW